jgi:hypothetical protein
MSEMLIKAAVREGLKTAFSGGSFNLCGVNSVLSALGRTGYRDTPDYKGLQAVHCLDWKQLTLPEVMEVHRVAFRVMGLKLPTARANVVEDVLRIPESFEILPSA